MPVRWPSRATSTEQRTEHVEAIALGIAADVVQRRETAKRLRVDEVVRTAPLFARACFCE